MAIESHQRASSETAAQASGEPRPEDQADWTVTQDRTPETSPRPRGMSPYRWIVTLLRRSWRGLTSMRTALILLFLLAVAAIPGSLLPQKNLNIEKVQQYYQDHPSLAPLLDKAGFFSVFSSVWFSAIYLLLFISLIGCVTPRLAAHWTAMRRQPPDAPSRLGRLPVSASNIPLPDAPAEAASKLKALLKSRRYRTVVRSHDDGTVTVSAEKGYLKETGNLLFHFSLVALLIGVAYGSWYGWHANRILVAGPDTAFCNTLTQYDDYSLGTRIDDSDLSPFCVKLDTFSASYLANGQPTQYVAKVQYTVGAGSADWKPDTLEVNKPLRLPHANVYLLGHGYAPIVKYTDKYGVSQTRVAPFLPIDGADTSTDVALFPDANINPGTGTNTDSKTFTKEQVGFSGVYVPTAAAGGAVSVYPAENNPVLVLTPYFGDLGLDNGVSQSVYELNQAQVASGALKPMKHVDPGTSQMTDGPLRLKPGQSATLTDGSTVQFVGTRPFATLSVRYDPGEKIVLVGAGALFVGLLLSLTGRRRRIWFRLRSPSRTVPSGPASAAEAPPGQAPPNVAPADVAPSGTVADAGGLARAEYASFPIEFQSIIKSAGGE
jgi:cytochrome c biogenesis protein